MELTMEPKQEGSPPSSPVQDAQNNVIDAEMTYPLTTNNEDSLSQSPTPSVDMSGYPKNEGSGYSYSYSSGQNAGQNQTYNANGTGSSRPIERRQSHVGYAPPGDSGIHPGAGVYIPRADIGSYPGAGAHPAAQQGVGHGYGGQQPHGPPVYGSSSAQPLSPSGGWAPTSFGASPPSMFAGGGRGRANSTMASQNQSILSSVRPGPVWPSEDQLNVAFSYAIRREDGTFTRLIRADQLASHYSHSNLPERQGPEGLIILPEPRQPSPTRRAGHMPFVPTEVVARLPLYDVNRPRQTFASPVNAPSIDAIVARAGSFSPTGPPPSVPRRTKIYCDKWVHEGVCAFTQIGCKYKHEMPLDKATQVFLGLNHGVPNWYRRAQAVNLYPAGAVDSVNNGGAYSAAHSRTMGAGSWRRNEASTPAIAPSAPAAPGGFSARSGFGPIGPPPPSAPLPVKLEEGEVEEDEDEITFRGRRRN